MKIKESFLRALIIILGFLIIPGVQSQQNKKFILNGTISGLIEKNIVFIRLNGHKEIKVKELQTDKYGSFTISLDEMLPIGQYRLRIDPGKQSKLLDFLITDNNLSFTTDIDFIIDSIHFENSEINAAWYNYFRTKENFESRLSILEHLMGIYPKDERFYPEIIKEFNLLQGERDIAINKISSEFSGTLLEAYIRADQPPHVNPFISSEERGDLFRRNFFKNIDFTDTMLLRTDIFPSKVLSYIMLYRNPQLNQEQQALEFIRATDNFLPLAMVQPVVYNYLLEYTISGFEQIGLEKVLQHIAEHYQVDETCVSDQGAGELQRRIEGYRKLAPGNKAPDINTKDISNNDFKLDKSKSEYILIVFWASWCPHCNVILPEIKKLADQLNAGYSKNPKLQVVSVSIDHEKEDYQEFLKENGMDDKALKNYWINICDYKAWDGKIANDYYLYATPTMVLLGKDGTITVKPSNIQELKKSLGL